MCGICGIIGEPNKHLLKLMCNILIHRGSNSEGYYIDDNVGLGVRSKKVKYNRFENWRPAYS